MKKLGIWGIFIICWIQTANLEACSYAYQYSLFPLGSSAGELIMLEVELERYVNSPSSGMLMPQGMGPGQPAMGETRWKGLLKLVKTKDGQAFEKVVDVAYVDLSDERYEAALAPHFEAALRAARELPFFKEAILQEVAYCRYDRTCSLFELRVDSLQPALQARIAKQQNTAWQSADFPPILKKKFENITQLNLDESDAATKSSRITFYQVWKPYAARKYLIDGQEVIVYVVGWGRKRGYAGKKEPGWLPNSRPVDNFIEGNDVMMHGQRFDFCQIL